MVRRSILPLVLVGATVSLAACGSSAKHTASATSAAPAAVATITAPASVTSAAAAATAAHAAEAQAATPATNPIERLSGTVQSVSGAVVTLKEGGSFMLTAQTAITRRMPSTVAALKPGQVVAVTAKHQPDNTLLASLIVVFPTAPKGFPLGQRPLDQGNLMTNATIEKVSGTSFTVTFPGGGAQVMLAADGQGSALAAGTAADITAGASITASVKDGIAQAISIQ